MVNDAVIEFINRFTNNGKNAEVIKCFSNGCCYWFAAILKARFKEYCTIMYDSVENHFAARVFDKIYDITGDISGEYAMKPFDEFSDDLERARIVRNCVLFI